MRLLLIMLCLTMLTCNFLVVESKRKKNVQGEDNEKDSDLLVSNRIKQELKGRKWKDEFDDILPKVIVKQKLLTIEEKVNMFLEEKAIKVFNKMLGDTVFADGLSKYSVGVIEYARICLEAKIRKFFTCGKVDDVSPLGIRGNKGDKEGKWKRKGRGKREAKGIEGKGKSGEKGIEGEGKSGEKGIEGKGKREEKGIEGKGKREEKEIKEKREEKEENEDSEVKGDNGEEVINPSAAKIDRLKQKKLKTKKPATDKKVDPIKIKITKPKEEDEEEEEEEDISEQYEGEPLSIEEGQRLQGIERYLIRNQELAAVKEDLTKPNNLRGDPEGQLDIVEDVEDDEVDADDDEYERNDNEEKEDDDDAFDVDDESNIVVVEKGDGEEQEFREEIYKKETKTTKRSSSDSKPKKPSSSSKSTSIRNKITSNKNNEPITLDFQEKNVQRKTQNSNKETYSNNNEYDNNNDYDNAYDNEYEYDNTKN